MSDQEKLGGFLCVLVSLLILLSSTVYSIHHEIVRLENESLAFIFRRNLDTQIRLLPDEETAERFPFYDSASTRKLSNEELWIIKVGDPVPVLHITDTVNPDETMRIVYDKALVLTPPDGLFTVIGKRPGLFNPAMTKIWDGRIFVCWGKEPKQGFLVHCGWMKDGSYMDISDETLLGWGPQTALEQQGGFSYFEDPRILAVSGERIIIEYSAVYWTNVVFLKYGILTLNKMTNELELDVFRVHQNQKNWIIVEGSDEQVYFIASINPLRVVRMFDRSDGEEGFKLAYEADAPVHLPWDPEYGTELRGGTPAVLITNPNKETFGSAPPSMYISFFHTNCNCELPHYGYISYWMGAVTFCPTFPFNIHSISPSPILNGDMYTGEWCKYLPHQQVDYVIYPTGIVVEDNGQYMVVSAGHQNDNLMVMNFSIPVLLASMVVVSEC